ncbi:MAG: hypothetical protein QNJ61_12335, partial [Desulfobacterales bacterium]|nr:hypothetical protein [Desulfobacterales bacterium]
LAVVDDLVKSRIYPGLVILAQARIQQFQHVLNAGYVIPDLIRSSMTKTILFRAHQLFYSLNGPYGRSRPHGAEA